MFKITMYILIRLGYIGIWTQDLWIKSPMLYQLSYVPIEILHAIDYNAKRIKNAIINEKSAMASVSANPRIASLNNSSFKEGFRETPITNAPNTVPIPTPAPASPIVASPAPIDLAACNNM